MINPLVIGSLPLSSDFPSRKHWEAAVWQIIIERITKLQSEEDLAEALEFLLSPQERKGITYRALAASRLAVHIGPSEISRELWLTRQTISAIKKSLHEGSYKSSRARGHKPKKYNVGPAKPKKKFYRNTKYGPIRDWDRME